MQQNNSENILNNSSTSTAMEVLLTSEKNPAYKEGVPAADVPAELKEILPNIRFLQPTNKPGIFGLYFKNEKKIYISESGRVSGGISMHRSFQGTQIEIIRHLKSNNGEMQTFVIFQGKILKDKKIRSTLHRACVAATENHNINILGSRRSNDIQMSEFANKQFLQTKKIEGSLKPYGFNLKGVPFPDTGGCIYGIINPVSKRIYIGETSDFDKCRVMRRHRSTIYAFKKRLDANTLKPKEITVKKLFDDLTLEKNTLLFVCLKPLDSATKKERVSEETKFKLAIEKEYPGRMYNLQNPVSTGPKEHSEFSKELIRTAAKSQVIKQDLTVYPCICHGKWYNSRAEASLAYGYKSKDGLKYKLRNPEEKDFIWLKEMGNKELPDDPEIKAKVENFFKNLKKKPIRFFFPKKPTN